MPANFGFVHKLHKSSKLVFQPLIDFVGDTRMRPIPQQTDICAQFSLVENSNLGVHVLRACVRKLSSNSGRETQFRVRQSIGHPIYAMVYSVNHLGMKDTQVLLSAQNIFSDCRSESNDRSYWLCLCLFYAVYLYALEAQDDKSNGRE